MSDLVQTLRDMVYPCCEEAADEITRLRSALREIAEVGYVRAKDAPIVHDEAIRIARAALGEKA